MTRTFGRILGLGLFASAIAAGSANASPLAYILNADDGTVSVIDTDTNTIVKTMFGHSHPLHAAVNSAGTRLYMTDTGFSPGLLRVINTQTHAIMQTIQVTGVFGSLFSNLILNPTQPFGYLAYAPDKIFVIDTGSNIPGGTFTVPVSGGDQIGNIAINPSGTTIYATKLPGGDISVIDAATGLEIDTIAGGGFGEVIVDPTGALVYAVDETFPNARDEIIVSDTATNTVVDSVSFPGCTFLRGLTFDATGATLYAACGTTSEVAVIDTATLTALEVPVGFVPLGTSLTPDGARLYVTNQGSNDVSVLDTATNTVVDTVPVGDEPASIGKFIGPNFVCGNAATEPGEGCDDGNITGGDGCSSNCYAEHESVIAPVKSASLRIASGATFGETTVKVKIRNGGTTTHSIAVIPTTSCIGVNAYSDFGSGFNLPVPVEAGKSAKGTVRIIAAANSMFQLNALSPVRCTYTFTASVQPNDFTADPTPSNNVAIVELDIFDDNQADMSTVHETKILPTKTVKMKIKDGAASASKKVKFKVGSADYLPSPEPASSHSVSVTGADGTCPPLTVGPATVGGSASAGVEGGDTESGEVTVTISAADVNSPSKTTPARCAATLTAVGPSGDSVPSNDTTSVVIEISDLNDF